MNKDILMSDMPEWARAMAPCLTDSPYSAAARNLVVAALALPDDGRGGVLKAMASFDVFAARHMMDSAVIDDAAAVFADALNKSADFLKSAAGAASTMSFPCPDNERSGGVEEQTASHYSNLFKQIDDEKYYEEPILLLSQRLERNNFPCSLFPQWRALDAGCGNGRYTLALKAMGMGEVVGLDLSPDNVKDAEARRERKNIENVSYKQGSALDLPFENGEFDFVFSNGVLHHTTDPQKGVNELLRILKPGGCGFFKVMANPGGIHWDAIELCRIILSRTPYSLTREVYAMMGVPANLRYYFIDHMMAPINIRYTEQECVKMLSDAGAINIRWLERGADIDRTELRFHGKKGADIIYGIGENRFYFEKP